MTAANNSKCNCELCAPNWHLGESDDFVPVPETDKATQNERDKKEAAEHYPAALLAFADN